MASKYQPTIKYNGWLTVLGLNIYSTFSPLIEISLTARTVDVMLFFYVSHTTPSPGLRALQVPVIGVIFFNVIRCGLRLDYKPKIIVLQLLLLRFFQYFEGLQPSQFDYSIVLWKQSRRSERELDFELLLLHGNIVNLKEEEGVSS